MRLLWFTWKDRKHPTAGGAEVLNEEHAKRLVEDGHEVIMIVGGFKGGKSTEIIDGYRVIRLGNKWTIYWEAYRYYKKHLSNWPDLIIEEINTFPFFTQFYAKQKRLLYIFQLCREIWFYEIFFPLNIIGYIIEPVYLLLLRTNKVITESQSTKNDLQKYGFKENNIHIVPIGIDIEPAKNPRKIRKYPDFTILSFGSIRSMKQTHHQLEAFELAKKDIPGLKMIVAGPMVGKYGEKFIQRIKSSPYKSDVTYLGTVSKQKKKELMQKSHALLVTSVKEGWGLVVTEAASQGTPAIVYDADGLRDSVKDGITGIICKKNTPGILSKNIVKLCKDKTLYNKLQKKIYGSITNLDLDQSYVLFKNSITNK